MNDPHDLYVTDVELDGRRVRMTGDRGHVGGHQCSQTLDFSAMSDTALEVVAAAFLVVLRQRLDPHHHTTTHPTEAIT